MAGDVGQAFIRIRPNTAGFKSEAETGIRAGLSPLAKIGGLFGIALGAEAAAGFVKGIVEHAADMQKQTQAVTQEFGKAGAEEIKQFGEGAATALGLSAHAAETTANRFGLLFNSLQIGGPKAVEMTINLEKLGASVAQIRNIDPTSFFSTLPTALAGNLRSLKQMGIATNALEIEQRSAALTGMAFTTQLTPQQKALAVYSIIMDHFNKITQDAAAHQDSLGNVLRRIKAEWDNQKDALGAGLLPILSKVGLFVARDLPKAFVLLHNAAADIATVFKDLYKVLNDVDPFGKAKTAIAALTAAFVASKIVGWTGLLKSAGTQAAATAAEVATSANSIVASEAKVAAATTKTMEQLKAEANIVQVPGEGVRRVRGMEGMLTGNTFQGGAKEFRSKATGQFGALRQTFPFAAVEKDSENSAKKVAGAWGNAFDTIKKGATSTGSVIRTGFSSFGQQVSSVATTASTKFAGFFTGLKVTALTTLDTIKAAFISAIPILLISVAIQLIIEHFNTIKKVFFAVVAGIEGSWDGLKNVLIGTAKFIAGAMATYLTFPLNIFLRVLDKVSGVLSVIGINIGTTVHQAQKELASITTGFAVQGVEQAKKGAGEIVDAFAGGFAGQFQKKNSAITGDKNNDPVYKALLQRKLNAQTIIDQYNKQLAQLADPSSLSIRTAKEHLINLGNQLSQAIINETNDVRDAVNQAKQQLYTLGSDLGDAVSAMLNAPIQAEQAQLQKFQDKRSLELLRESVFLPGGKELSKDPKKAIAQLEELSRKAGTVNRNAIQQTIIQLKQAQLQVAQDNANTTARITKNRLQQLAYELSQHKISLRTFQKDEAGALRSAKIPYAAAGAYLGQAFFEQFKQQGKDLLSQAEALAKSPNVRGTSPFATTIVKPFQTLHKDNVQIARIQASIVTAQERLRVVTEKHAVQVNKDAAKAQKIRVAELGVLKQLYQINKQIAVEDKKRSSRAKNPGHQTHVTRGLVLTNSAP